MNQTISPTFLKDLLGGRNLYLIGMMASGKTLTGPPLANQIKYGFVDIDSVIEKVSKKSIEEIFQDHGEKYFRSLESDVLKEIGQHYSLVVSTGGGIITRSENWGILHQGIVIWIDPGRDQLLKRLENDQKVRPMLKSDNPKIIFDEIYKARYPLYEESDLHIFVNDESPLQVAEKIVQNLPSILTDRGSQGARQTIAK